MYLDTKLSNLIKNQILQKFEIQNDLISLHIFNVNFHPSDPWRLKGH